jgi:phosphatidylglycerophosphate synthase
MSMVSDSSLVNSQKDEPYLRWEYRTLLGRPKAKEITRRNWRTRVAMVVLMWAILIGLLGFLVGSLDFVIFASVFLGLIVTGIVYWGWSSGRDALRKKE